MLRSSRARLAYAMVMLTALSGMGALAVVVLKQSFTAGVAEASMMAAILAVVVVLPLVLVLLPVASWLRMQAGVSGIIPRAGENVPGAGQ